MNQILQLAPKPLPNVITTSFAPHHLLHLARRSEPITVRSIFCLFQMFTKSLIQSAQYFLGKKFQGAVITVHATFADVLEKVIRALTSFNYLMKPVRQRRPLPPTFGALTSKLIVPNLLLWISVPLLFPSLYSL